MEDHASLLLTLALGFVMAFALGFTANRFRLPPLVGYLVAGILIGPFTPGFAADTAIASQLAEVGVILLMFGVGLHFSVGDLLAVKWIAIPGAIGQILVATLMGAILAACWDWPLTAAFVLGLALSVASTVVVLRALEEREAVDSVDGRIAVAWLVVEDLAMVLALVLLPMLAGLAGGEGLSAPGELAWAMAVTAGKLALFLAIAVVLGPRVVPWLLTQAARAGSRELFTLAVLAIAIGIAFGSATLFGVSFALGAFCAGVVLSNSELSHRAAEESLPLQHAFAVLFFVSVGMLFNPLVLARDPLAVLGVLAIILVGKSIVAFIIVQALGYPVGTALLVSASLAQIGEFSFILAGLGIALGVFPEVGRDLILAGALLSVSLNPLAFAIVPRLRGWFHRHQHIMARFEAGQDLRLARLRAALDAQKQKKGGVRVPPDELIGKWKVFAELDVVNRAELLALFKPRTAGPGERLIRTGEAAKEIFFISSGKVAVSVGGRKITLGPGDFFGEMALLSGAPRSADVTAIDYCQLLTLDRADFDRYVARHPDLREKIDVVAERRDEENRALVAAATS
ncbi:MAG: cation:proton antiporter [Vicinamibacterales bacterium]